VEKLDDRGSKTGGESMIQSLKETVPGDIILSRDNNLTSRLIRFFGKLQTEQAEYSHAMVAVGNSLCVESLMRVRVSDLKNYEKNALEVWRLPISPLERGDLERGMVQVAGNDYGGLMIPLFALDAVATSVARVFGRKTPVFFFTEKFGLFNIPVCSQLVMWGFEKFTDFTIRDAAHNRVSWKLISPDYLQDLLRIPHNNAKLIYKQEAK
jgi:hypothetical protein